VVYLITSPTGQVEPAYAVVTDDQDEPVECWPRTMEGAVTATNRAAWLSRTTGQPHELHRPDGRLLARFVNGRRTDLAHPMEV
jgi:hypothetical protein